MKKFEKSCIIKAMGLFDWIKNSGEKLRRVEDKIYQQRTDFVEIYQKNLALEKEISQRTEELHKSKSNAFNT